MDDCDKLKRHARNTKVTIKITKQRVIANKPIKEKSGITHTHKNLIQKKAEK